MGVNVRPPGDDGEYPTPVQRAAALVQFAISTADMQAGELLLDPKALLVGLLTGLAVKERQAVTHFLSVALGRLVEVGFEAFRKENSGC